MEWIIDNLEYVVGMIVFVIVGVIAKLTHGNRNKGSENSPDLKNIENELTNLKDDFDEFKTEIRDLIENETQHGIEVHKMIFQKLDDVSTKIDYTRGQVDLHLKNID